MNQSLTDLRKRLDEVVKPTTKPAATPTANPATAPKVDPGNVLMWELFEASYLRQVPNVVDLLTVMNKIEYSTFAAAPIDTPELLRNLPDEELPLRQLIPTQSTVYRDDVYVDHGLFILRWFGRNYISDGHHRYMGLQDGKHTQVSCKVLEPRPSTRWEDISTAVAEMERLTGYSLQWKVETGGFYEVKLASF